IYGDAITLFVYTSCIKTNQMPNSRAVARRDWPGLSPGKKKVESCRVINLHMDGVVALFCTLFDVHSAGDPLISEILEHTAPEALDQLNETRRQIERQDALFSLTSSEVQYEISEPVEKATTSYSSVRTFGSQNFGQIMDIEVEPLFASMALYDCKERKKCPKHFIST
ncbi:hypothetical protein NQ318_017070, partial [Aromia moschata]